MHLEILLYIMIDELENIGARLQQEKMDVCVVCYGGCSSNTLVNTLEKNGLICKTPLWDKIVCHCPIPFETDIPIIYLYRNPREAFASMKRRSDVWKTNQIKLTNNKDCVLSDEHLLRFMIYQWYTWTKYAEYSFPKKILFIRYEQLFQPDICLLLQNFLQKQLHSFPIQYEPPKPYNYSVSDIELFKKYAKQLTSIDTYEPVSI